MEVVLVMVMVTMTAGGFFASALDNGVGSRPVVGWTTGSRYSCLIDCQHYPEDCISEHLIKVMADYLSLTSFRSAGYDHLVVGDCWMDPSRDAKGRLQADRKRFPGGMGALVAYLHRMNLKVGLLLDLSKTTCGGFPGSWGNFRLDAETVAAWDVDMVTVTGCQFNQVSQLNEAYMSFGRELRKAKRSVLYSCDWPVRSLQKNWGHPSYMAVSQACNTFKITKASVSAEDTFATLKNVQDNSYLYKETLGNGTLVDLDELTIGSRVMGEDQERFQMAFWALLSSPLLVSADLTDMTSTSKRILLNRDVLGISQDPLGSTAVYMVTVNSVSIWVKPISPAGSFAVGFFYTDTVGLPAKVSVRLSDLGVVGSPRFNATDVYAGHHHGVFKPWHFFNCEVEPMSVLLVKFVPM